MVDNKLLKKLLIKEGQSFLIVNAPTNIAAIIDPVPRKVDLRFVGAGVCDVLLLFCRDSAELDALFEDCLLYVKPETVFWIAYPKKSSGISSDLGMMQQWPVLVNNGYNFVASAAVDTIWTALRIKPQELIKDSDTCNSAIETNDYGKYVDTVNRQIILPNDLKQAMELAPSSLSFFDKLSFTNKKEYVLWVLTAKQEKTRLDRITKTVDKLLAGKKNPSEK